MSKPLTIEELKALKKGDWVYVVDNELPQYTGYYKIDLFAISHLHIVQGLRKAVIPFSKYGKTWLAYKNKEEAEGKYDSQAVELEAVTQDKANLERTIEEINEALKDNGITIDSDGNVNDSLVEGVKKQVAKEILQDLYETIKQDVKFSLMSAKQIVIYALNKYGVEVDK